MRTPINLVRILLILFLLSSLFIPQSRALAAGIVVDTDADTIDANGGTCGTMNIGHLPGADGFTSLREAICAANGTAGDDEITFAGDYTITLGSTLPNISSTMMIDGTGQTVTVHGNSSYRVFYVAASGDLMINNLTIARGYALNGGGIYNAGTLAVTNSTFYWCAALNNTLGGGGIYNAGTITTISNSTFSRNRADDSNGGGIYNSGIINTIENSTFYYGWTFAGGGIYNAGTINTINNSTFSHGFTSLGAGIYNAAAITTISNTIIANTLNGVNCVGTIPATANSLSSDASCGAASVETVPANIGLNGLADNGGPTETMSLNWDSVALNVGDTAACAEAGGLDQRGVTRYADECDIGAFERDTEGPQVESTSLLASYTGSGPSTFTVTFNVNVSNEEGGTGINDVENPANYLLLEEGTLAGFQTTACNSTDLVNDTQITVGSDQMLRKKY